MPVALASERGVSHDGQQMEGSMPSGSVALLDRNPDRRIPRRPQKPHPGSRQALIAAAQARPGEKNSGVGYSYSPESSSNRAANHATPVSPYVVPLFTPPPLSTSTSTHWESWESRRRPMPPDKKASEDHSRSAAAARATLYDSKQHPVHRQIAALAAQDSMTVGLEIAGTSRAPGAFLENPEIAVRAFKDSSPGLVRELYDAHKAAVRGQEVTTGPDRNSHSPQDPRERRDLRIQQAKRIERLNRQRRQQHR